MSSRKFASLRTQRAGISLCAALALALWTPLATANVFSDAWDCAKGSAEAGYALAGKGAKALQVLGQAPQCVAYATAGDVPLYATTGALFTLNAIDSSIVSSTNCVSSVKAHAVVPMGKLLDGTFSGVIPENLLDAGSQEATDQLWEFMHSTPPISAAIDRIDCGCTFLEAGVSVQNLVEIFTIIAQAGEQCDAALSNVPGYQTVKAGVQAGGTAMNNLGEDIFTDQVQHKDVEQYYFVDFDGGSDSYAAQSHAAARVLDPGHDWRTQDGAAFLSDTVVKLGAGANNGNQKKKTCVEYFDSHKMSSDNANEVCEAMVQRFDNDYKSLVARMSKQDILVKQLEAKLSALSKQGKAECGTRFPPEGDKIGPGGLYDGFGPSAGAHNHCLVAMGNSAGILGWHNPYAAVGSLGTPIDPDIIDAQLATGKTYYFVAPIEKTGARKIAWDAFENNGGDGSAALAQGLLAYEMMHDKILADSQASYDKQVMLAKQNKQQMVKNAAGFAFPNCPAGDKYQACIDALGDAVQVCLTQIGTVPLSGEFPKPGEQAKIDAIWNQCNAGYVGLSVELGERAHQEKTWRYNLSNACPKDAEGLRKNCLTDVESAIASCQGGEPRMTSGYFISKQFAQDPTPQMACDMAWALFKGKWGADEAQIARINAGSSEALKACIAKVPNSGDCQQQVGELAASCRVDLQQTANLLLGNLSLQSQELGNAKTALAVNADDCIAQMMAIPDKLSYGHEAEVLMLSKYGSRCMRNTDCTQLLSTTLQQCQGGAVAGGTSGASGRPGAAAGARPTSAGGHAAGARNTLSMRSAKLAAAPNAAVMAMNNPSAFKATNTAVLQLAKTPEQVVAECSDELEAALAKFGHSDVPNVAATPAQMPPVALLPNANTGVVGPARTPASATRTPSDATRAPSAATRTPSAATRAPSAVTSAPTAPMVLQRIPGAAAASPTVTLQPGMDRMGGDFRGFALRDADPQLCRQACADDAACRAYTYVNPGLKGPQAMCFLKNSTPPATPDNCCTSGEKSSR